MKYVRIARNFRIPGAILLRSAFQSAVDHGRCPDCRETCFDLMLGTRHDRTSPAHMYPHRSQGDDESSCAFVLVSEEPIPR